ncbi:hypothetical protein LXL04_015058 [Taraxacum kok-saghyz]
MPRIGRLCRNEAVFQEVGNHKCRNAKKRDARRSFRWGMELAELNDSQIKRILRVVSLEEEVFDAIMLSYGFNLLQKLGRDVREGKRRQFSFIGKLLRDVEPDLMEGLIKAMKDSDFQKFQELSGASDKSDPVDITEVEEETGDEEEEEDEGRLGDIASRWFDGLVNKDIDITNEIYSLSTVEFDRQELRKLVRTFCSMQSATWVNVLQYQMWSYRIQQINPSVGLMLAYKILSKMYKIHCLLVINRFTDNSSIKMRIGPEIVGAATRCHPREQDLSSTIPKLTGDSHGSPSCRLSAAVFTLCFAGLLIADSMIYFLFSIAGLLKADSYKRLLNCSGFIRKAVIAMDSYKRLLNWNYKDAYGFLVRPQHVQRYREYSSIYKNDNQSLLIFPIGNNVDHLSMYLDVVDSSTLPYGWSRYAQFNLGVVNQAHNKLTIRKDTQQQFNSRESNWGFTSFMPLSELYDPSRGYLLNDKCIVEADVAALGSGFAQFSQPVFQRCLDIIQTQKLAKVDPLTAAVSDCIIMEEKRIRDRLQLMATDIRPLMLLHNTVTQLISTTLSQNGMQIQIFLITKEEVLYIASEFCFVSRQ